LFEGQVAFDGLADLVAGCRVAIGRAQRASGTGPGGFRCGRRTRCRRVEVAKPSPNPRRHQPARFAHRFLPGAALILDQRSASRSCVWTVRISQVQRSADSGSRSFGRVQPKVCLNSRNVCSRSNRRQQNVLVLSIRLRFIPVVQMTAGSSRQPATPWPSPRPCSPAAPTVASVSVVVAQMVEVDVVRDGVARLPVQRVADGLLDDTACVHIGHEQVIENGG
jgi:hypothetical protein